MNERTIFLAALEIDDPKERANYLNQACAGDRALRQRVDSLLAAHQLEDGFLESPVMLQRGDHPSSPSDSNHSEVLDRPRGDTSENLSFLSPSSKPGSLGRLGPYEVLEVIGKNASVLVLRALDEQSQRTFAIKALARPLANNVEAKLRFVREARAAAAVKHDNVVPILAVQDAGPVPYLVLEFVQGQSLQDRLDRHGPPSLREIVHIGQQIAEGLAAGHKQGLIHRNLKPANILLENGLERARITDFGLSQTDNEAAQKQSGVGADTLQYQSPEQAESKPVDPRSDLFSLGSVLYALCTGHAPFRAETSAAVLKLVRESTPKPLQAQNSEIPDWLEVLIGRLHSKDPANRLGSATEVAQQLGRQLALLPPFGRSSARSRVSVPGLRAGSVRMWLAGSAAALLVAVGCVSAYLLFPKRNQVVDTPLEAAKGEPDKTQRFSAWPPLTPEQLARVPSPLDGRKRGDVPTGLLGLGGDANQIPQELVAILADERFQPQPERVTHLECSPEGRLLAVSSGQRVCLFDLKTGRLERIIEPLNGRAHRTAFSPRSTRLAIASGADDKEPVAEVWDIETGKHVQTFRGHHEGVLSVLFGPDSDMLITSSKDRTVRIWEVATGQEKHSFVHGDHVHGLALSPDGKYLVTGSNDRAVRIYDLAAGKLKRRLAGHNDAVASVCFSPDGKLLASAGSELKLWDTKTFAPVRTIPGAGGWGRFAADSESYLCGKAAYQDGESHTVSRWDVNSGKKLAEMPLLTQGNWALYALTPDGKFLFDSRLDPPGVRVRAYDAETGKELNAHRGHLGAVTSVAISPDGRLLASGGEDRTVRLWDLSTCKEQSVLGKHAHDVTSLAFSPDGKLLASASPDTTIVLWDVNRGQEFRTLNRRSRNLSGVAFSSDGLTLAAGGDDGHLLRWEVASGNLKEPLRWHSGQVLAVAFSPDGKLLATAGSDKKLHVGDVSSGKIQRTFAIGEGCQHLRFSPDAQLLAASCDSPSAYHVWELQWEKETLYPAPAGKIGDIALAPGGGPVATGLLDGTVTFWDRGLPDKRLHTSASGSVGVRQVAFTPEGRYLATANENGSLSILRVPAVPPTYSPGPALRLPDPAELAKRVSLADTLARDDIPLEALSDKAPPELVAVLGDRRFQHDGPVRALRFIDGDKTLVSVGKDKTVRFWDAASGHLRRMVRINTSEYSGCAISPDGSILALGYDATGLVILWDLNTEKEIRQLSNAADRGVLFPGIAFSPDGKKLVTGGRWYWFKLWDVANGKELWKAESPGCNTFGFTFSPDGQTVVSCNEDGNVRLWDVENGQLRKMIQGSGRATFTASYTPDGQSLAWCSHDGTVKLWNSATGREVFTCRGHTATVGIVAISPDGRTIASGSGDKTVRLWEASTGKERATLQGHTAAVTSALVYTADGSTLASAGDDGIIRFWDTGTGKERFPHEGHVGRCLAVAISPDGRSMVSAGEDHTLQIWDLAGGKSVRPLVGHAAAVQVVCYSPNGKWIASQSVDGILYLWDVATGKVILTAPGLQGDSKGLAFTPDSLALVAVAKGGGLLIYDVATGKVRARLPGHRGAVAGLSFSPDGKLLASVGGDGARVWELATGWQIHEFRGPPKGYTGVAFHPAGDSVALAAPEATTEVRDVVTGTSRAKFSAASDRLCFRADGRVLVASSPDNTLRLWDVSVNTDVKKSIILPVRVNGIALTSEGRYLATANEDGTIYLLRLAKPGFSQP